MGSKLSTKVERVDLYSSAERRYLAGKNGKCWLMEWGTSQGNFKFSTFADWLTVRRRQEADEKKLLGVRALFLDILNLNGQWDIQA